MIDIKKVFQSDWCSESDDDYIMFDGQSKVVVKEHFIEHEANGFIKDRNTGIVTEDFIHSVTLKKHIWRIDIQNEGLTNEGEIITVNLWGGGQKAIIRFAAENKDKAIRFYEYLLQWIIA
jgi:hypothetical protein